MYFFLSVDIQHLYNKLLYNTVLHITRISVGPEFVILDFFSYITTYMHYTLVITGYGKLTWILAWPQTIVYKEVVIY